MNEKLGSEGSRSPEAARNLEVISRNWLNLQAEKTEEDLRPLGLTMADVPPLLD